MGDIIGAIFGTSQTGTEQTTPDPVAQMLNMQRLQQLNNYFSVPGNSLYQFGQPGPAAAYNVPEGVWRAHDTARSALLANPTAGAGEMMRFGDYQRSFDPILASVEADRNRLAGQTEQGYDRNAAIRDLNLRSMQDAVSQGVNRNYADYGTGRQVAQQGYQQGTAQVNQAYQAALNRGDLDAARAIAASDVNLQRNLATSQQNYGQGMDVSTANLLRNLGINEQTFQQAYGANQGNLQQNLAAQEANRARALQLGIGATDNYISQIATPRLNAALALQGLESGGAVPSAIARATAETAMPYLSSIENMFGTNQAGALGQYGSNQANLLASRMGQQTQLGSQTQAEQTALAQALMGLQGQMGQQTQAEQAATLQGLMQLASQAGGQRMGALTQLSGNYTGQEAALLQQLMSGNVGLAGQRVGAETELGGQYAALQDALARQQIQGDIALTQTVLPQWAQFQQSMPGASQALTLLPQAHTNAQIANATAFMPMADYGRQLAESDWLRRQGMAQTALTGLPFSPGSTTGKQSGTGNIFDQLGSTISSGATGGQGGFSTLGTKF